MGRDHVAEHGAVAGVDDAAGSVLPHVPSPCTCWQLPVAALARLTDAQILQLLLSFSSVASLDADVEHLLLPAFKLMPRARVPEVLDTWVAHLVEEKPLWLQALLRLERTVGLRVFATPA